MKITHEIKSYLTTMILLEAFIETIRPEIEGIYNEIFFDTIPDRLRVDRHTGEPITNQKYSYKLDYDDAETKKYIDLFGEEAKKVLLAKGWKPSKPDCCYLLECEALLRDITRYFVKACIKTLPAKVLEGFTPESYFESLEFNLFKAYKPFVKLNRDYYTQFISKKDLVKDFKPDFNLGA